MKSSCPAFSICSLPSVVSSHSAVGLPLPSVADTLYYLLMATQFADGVRDAIQQPPLDAMLGDNAVALSPTGDSSSSWALVTG